jgi:hypothetical protein
MRAKGGDPWQADCSTAESCRLAARRGVVESKVLAAAPGLFHDPARAFLELLALLIADSAMETPYSSDGRVFPRLSLAQ